MRLKRIVVVLAAVLAIFLTLSLSVTAAETFWDGSGTESGGSGEACSKYDVKLDATKTCQQCGLPKGDGHNGTCFGTINWENGGVKICHHYD